MRRAQPDTGLLSDAAVDVLGLDESLFDEEMHYGTCLNCGGKGKPSEQFQRSGWRVSTDDLRGPLCDHCRRHDPDVFVRFRNA